MTKKTRNYYDVLGVAPNATPEEIKKAHRKAVRRVHPDHNPDADPAEAAEINVAADVLLDPVLRLEYDDGGYREGKDGKSFAAAMGVVKAAIEGALDQGVEDIPHAVLFVLSQNIKANQKRVAELKKAKATLIARRKRISRKAPAGEPNLIHQVIDAKVLALEEQIEGTEGGLTGLELTRDAFTGYRDAPEFEGNEGEATLNEMLMLMGMGR